MANKPVFTKEQAKAFEQFTAIRRGVEVSIFAKERGTFSYAYTSLNSVTVDEFARAVHGGGYELEDTSEQDYWDALGRNVAEFHEGDVMLDKNGGYIHGSRFYAAQQYYEGNFSGLYPSESFKPFGKDVR